MIYITFDEFYGVNEYNSFITAAKNNNVEFSEWISTRTPYNWYIRIDEKDTPKFVDYEKASDSDERFLIKKIDPMNTQDEYALLRRETDSGTNFTKFVINDMWEYISNSGNIVVFRDKSKESIMKMSKSPELLDSKIFIIGNYRGWDLYVTDNKMIEGNITKNQLVYTSYNDKVLMTTPTEIEAYLNYYILRSDKISTKNFKTPYIMNGKFYPIIISGKYS